MVGAPETLGLEVRVPEAAREAAPPLHGQLLAQQPALPLLPLLHHRSQHRPLHSQSLLLQKLLHAERVHAEPVLPALQGMR